MTVATPNAGATQLGRVERRRLRDRATMLDVAEEMFASLQFAEVKIEVVADRADVSVGTFYTHFRSKDGLFGAVAERALERAVVTIEDAAKSAGSQPLERFLAVGKACMEMLFDSPHLARSLLAPPIQASDPANDEVPEKTALLYESLAAVIRECISSGDIKEVDADRIATFLINSWCGIVAATNSSLARPLDRSDAEKTLAEFSNALMLGLVPR